MQEILTLDSPYTRQVDCNLWTRPVVRSKKPHFQTCFFVMTDCSYLKWSASVVR